MFHRFLLILFLCGLTAVSVVLSYRASAEPFACPPSPVCLPETPPPCETIRCLPSWQKQMIEPVMRSPQVFPQQMIEPVMRSPQVFPQPQRSTDSILCRGCSLRMSCGQ